MQQFCLHARLLCIWQAHKLTELCCLRIIRSTTCAYRMRLERAQRLKELKSNPAAAAEAIAVDAAVVAAVPAAAGRRRRVVDVLQEVLGAGSDEDSSSAEDEGEEDDALLDWRAKGVA